MKRLFPILTVFMLLTTDAYAQVGILERMQQTLDEIKAKLFDTTVPPPVIPPPVPPPVIPPPVPPPTGGSGVNTIIPIVQTGAETNVPFSVPAAGNYIIWARVLAPTFSADSFFVSVDNGAEDIADMAENAQGPNFQWRRVPGRSGSTVPAAVTPRLFALATGSHTVKFREREPGLQINAILITDDPAFVPAGGTLPPPVVPPPVVPPPVVPPVVPPPQPPPPPGPIPTSGIFVSPTATATGTGTLTDPMNLQNAWAVPGKIPPGSTVWLRGGTYTWMADVTTTCTAALPCVVRSYPGEWAKVQGHLWVKTSYVTFRNFEVVGGDPNRRSTSALSYTPPDLKIGGIDIQEVGGNNKFINMVVHDGNNNGIGAWSTVPNVEIYGNLIYNNGWFGSDRAHGHGIYTQNLGTSPVKLIQDNIIFHNFVYGIQSFGSQDYTNNYTIDGNIFGWSGAPAGDSQYAMILGSNVTANNIIVDNNLVHKSWPFIGYQNNCNDNLSMNNNLFDNTLEIQFWKSITAKGNRIFGPVGERTSTCAPAKVDRTTNVVGGAKPTTGVEIFIRPNKYEAGRANVAIFNWGKAPTVSLSLSTVLKPGQAYELRDAYNFFGNPVLAGTYSGPLTVPMTGLVVAPGIGFPAIPHSAPEFAAFVVLGK